ncbi:hypothetical protein I6N95_26750 [Vagococcus sp. BWB3-3]|uniref:Uncharacterized protein n=1 Tax=Vagococcus allomyrinae TaxID=2794353 RepID=A0A940PBM5_9ENTE|nr:hypothetical protein [Vagococcus allomyrinae]MBP1044615.1 hypothetical protein [Vagococcus allomyrinae]
MKKVKNKNKKKMMGLAAALGLVTLLAGTFAWVAYEDQRINRVKTAAAGDTVLNENWEDPGEIAPGMAATKEVSVTNTGTAPTFVRISYEEVLTYLKSLGVETPATSGWTVGPDLPVDISVSKVADGAGTPINGYTDITGQMTVPVPAGVKVWGKGESKVNSSSGLREASVDYMIAFAYDSSNPAAVKYQKIDSTVEVDTTGGVPAVGPLNTTWKFTHTPLSYQIYAGGTAMAGFDWTDKNTLLGQNGVRHGVAFDYTLTNFTPALVADTRSAANVTTMVPVANGDIKGIQADDAILGSSLIKVKYGDAMTTTAAMGADKWVYNSDDGFFYFTNTLKGGQTTPDLLKELQYAQGAGDAFKGITYDLVVTMEAVQAESAALHGGSSQWNMDPNQPQTKLVLNQLLTSAGFPAIP